MTNGIGGGGGDGGADGGALGYGAAPASSGGAGLLATPWPTMVPMGEPLRQASTGAGLDHFPEVGGDVKFPKAAWDPYNVAKLWLMKFASSTEYIDLTIPKPKTEKAGFKSELNVVLERRLLRQRFAAEIRAQADNPEMYWSNLLMIGAHARPMTASLIAVGMAVGSHVAMRFKGKFNVPRPSQVFPALMPMIMNPGHPSYPSGHALQAHLIKHILNDGVLNGTGMEKPIEQLAWRIGINREIAGVHYQMDTLASIDLAQKVSDILKSIEIDWYGETISFSAYQEVVRAAEWPELHAGNASDLAFVQPPKPKDLAKSIKDASQKAWP